MRVLVIAAVVSLSSSAWADAPARIPVQGFLTDAGGTAVTGAHDLHFRIYTVASGGNASFDETLTGVSIEEGLFSVELGAANTPALDLSLFETESTLFLGITVDGDAELAPRISLGTVPWAAFANRAGDARTLDGLSPDDFRSSSDSISFTELVDVPAGLADGDDDTDTLGGLSCAPGSIAFFDGGNWDCLPFGGVGCGPGDVVTGFASDGSLLCQPPVDAAVRGQTCPANEFMKGINADGSIVCSTLDATVRTYVNTNCFIYFGHSDNCEAGCGTPAKMGRVNGNLNACSDDLRTATDNSCDTQTNLVGNIDIRTLGINPDGDVDGNDKFFIGFHCE